MDTHTKQTLKIYWQHAKPYKKWLFWIFLGMLTATVARLYEPFLYKTFFDNLASPNADPKILIRVLWLVAALNVGGWLFHRTEQYSNNFFQSRVKSDLMNTCFRYLQKHSYTFFNNSFAGSLVRKVNKYERSFEEIADQITGDMGLIVLRVLIIIIILLFTHPVLGFIVLGWSVAFAAFNYWFALFKMKYDIARAAMDTKVTGYLADAITNNINVKLFGGYGHEVTDFESLTDDLHQKRRRSWNWGHASDASQALLMIVLEFLVMYAAVRLWQQGRATVGDFALLQAYLVQLFNQLWSFGRYIRRIYEGLADANEMTEILIKPHDIQDRLEAKTLSVPAGKIDFENVTFGYGTRSPIFKHFNFHIEAGEKIALVGPSGGGKTTIVKLLFRFLDIQSGQILIDRQDIAEVTQDSLRANISLVPQEPILFHRTLMENIRYARPGATDAEVMKAARAAHCHEFIARFPEKYETFVGERGIKLSGGERQRVAIARAILKDAPILVLDEATSSLDSESEHLIQDALSTLMSNRTTIVIAHRLSTIMQMDRIVVIERGRITEQGRHEELLKAKEGTYQKLWEIQAGGFTAI